MMEGTGSQIAENQPLIEFLSKISNNSLDPIIRGQGRGPDFFQGLPARAHWGILRKGGKTAQEEGGTGEITSPHRPRAGQTCSCFSLYRVL